MTGLSPEAAVRSGGWPRPVRRVAVAAIALAIVGTVFALGVALGSHVAAPAVAPRNPFGTGLREAAPAAQGLGAIILALQASFYRGLTGALATLKRDGTGFGALVGIGFAYGIVHAAGPGHGKAVISGYLLASRRTLARGLALSGAASLLQAGVAVAVVAVLIGLAGATAASVSATANAVELASFAAVAAVGAGLLWRRTARVVPPGPERTHAPGAACECCAGGHIPSPEAVDRVSTVREAAGIVLAAGVRPCSGAIIILVFAWSQGLFGAGLAAVFAMALGTAITTGALAGLAVGAKGLALRLAAHRSALGALMPWLEVMAAAAVTATGLALLGATGAGAIPG